MLSILQLLLLGFRKGRVLGLRNLNSLWKCDQLIELEIQSVELRNGVRFYLLSGKIVLLCLSWISILEAFYKYVVLWFNPGRHLNTTQPLAHFATHHHHHTHTPRWLEGENQKGKVRKLVGGGKDSLIGKKGNKEKQNQENQVMIKKFLRTPHLNQKNPTIAHHQLTTAQPVPRQ